MGSVEGQRASDPPLEAPSPTYLIGSIAALKRLQREVFSELVTIKQRLEDLTPKKEVKDLVIPVDGSAVQAHTRQLSSRLRLRSDAQLSGVLSLGAMALVSQEGFQCMEQRLQEEDASPDGHADFLLQSTWGGGKTSASAGLRAHQHSPSSQQLQLRQVIIKHEVTPSMRLMLAPLRGSLENISRKVSPFAGPGLSAATRRSHSLAGLLCGGAGAGATFAHGPASLSLGHFISGVPSSSTAPVLQQLHHSVAQMSAHLENGACASLILSTSSISPFFVTHGTAQQPNPSRSSQAAGSSSSSNNATRPPGSNVPSPGPGAFLHSPGAAPASTIPGPASFGSLSSSLNTPRPLSFKGILLPHGSSSEEVRQPCPRGPARELVPRMEPQLGVQAGFVASLPVSDHCILSGWTSHRKDVASAWGLQVTAYDQMQECSGRAFIAAVRRSHPSIPGAGRPASALLVVEVCARIPLADGLSVTPGVMLHRIPRHSSVVPGVQMQWAY